MGWSDNEFKIYFLGKARRLKQAKDEATEEIEKYRGEREKQFKDFEAKVSLVLSGKNCDLFQFQIFGDLRMCKIR